MSGDMKRREFLKVVALTGAGLAASCTPAPTQAPTKAPAATSAPAATAVSAATAAPTKAPAAATPIPTVGTKKLVVTRYMTGGFTAAGKEDNLVKQYQEAAIKKDYGLDVDIQIESASWADIDALIMLRLQTKGLDVFQRADPTVLQAISNPGMIREIEAPLKQYGPNLLQKLPKVGFDYFMRDDRKLIAIPMMRITPVDPEYIHVRRDWCEKIDRPIPTTIEELEECLRLFKEKKLGGSVTIPMVTENPNWILQYAFVGPCMPEPEEQFKMMARGENIERLIGSNMTESRLELLARLYKDNLLNNEWATWKYDQVVDAISKGMVGCFLGVSSVNGFLQTQVEKADPKQDWVVIYPPLGWKGKPHTARTSTGGAIERGMVAASWAEAPEACIAWCDWETKSHDNWLVGRFGVPDKHWKKGSGGWIEDLRSPAPNQEYSGMRHTATSVEWRLKDNTLPPQPGKEPKDVLDAPRRLKNLHTRADATKPEKGEYPTITQIDHWCAYMFPRSAKFKGDLDALFKEYTTNIIAGQLKPAAGIKEFWSKWMAAGGNERMKEITEQYSKYIAASPAFKDPKIYLSPEAWNLDNTYPPKKKT
jgi:hypothetical protein